MKPGTTTVIVLTVIFLFPVSPVWGQEDQVQYGKVSRDGKVNRDGVIDREPLDDLIRHQGGFLGEAELNGVIHRGIAAHKKLKTSVGTLEIVVEMLPRHYRIRTTRNRFFHSVDYARRPSESSIYAYEFYQFGDEPHGGFPYAGHYRVEWTELPQMYLKKVFHQGQYVSTGIILKHSSKRDLEMLYEDDSFAYMGIEPEINELFFHKQDFDRLLKGKTIGQALGDSRPEKSSRQPQKTHLSIANVAFYNWYDSQEDDKQSPGGNYIVREYTLIMNKCLRNHLILIAEAKTERIVRAYKMPLSYQSYKLSWDPKERYVVVVTENTDFSGPGGDLIKMDVDRHRLEILKRWDVMDCVIGPRGEKLVYHKTYGTPVWLLNLDDRWQTKLDMPEHDYIYFDMPAPGTPAPFHAFEKKTVSHEKWGSIEKDFPVHYVVDFETETVRKVPTPPEGSFDYDSGWR